MNSQKFLITDGAGKFATYDTRSGAYLTSTAALAYVWSTREDAEKRLPDFSRALGVPLSVQPCPPTN